MSTINDIPIYTAPVICNFGWTPSTALPSFVEDGVSYPPSGAQYQSVETPTGNAITFYATDSASLGLPKLTVPPGVTIIQYRWDFGDGVIGYGQTVSHIYQFVIPGLQVNLSVTTNSGQLIARSQQLNLYAGITAIGSPFAIRRSS
jgi:hypothetical protein